MNNRSAMLLAQWIFGSSNRQADYSKEEGVHKFQSEGSKMENIADVLWKTLGQSASGDAGAICENVIGTGCVKCSSSARGH